MTTLRLCNLMSLVSLALLAACGTEPDANPLALEAYSFANSEWSPPVNLGSAINTAAVEANPTLSPDELSLYFQSDRSLGYGGTDIWVSRRACETCPWEEPENLGSLINTSGNEGAPSISLDGHLLFFYSAGLPGGQGDRRCRRRASGQPQGRLRLGTRGQSRHQRKHGRERGRTGVFAERGGRYRQPVLRETADTAGCRNVRPLRRGRYAGRRAPRPGRAHSGAQHRRLHRNRPDGAHRWAGGAVLFWPRPHARHERLLGVHSAQRARPVVCACAPGRPPELGVQRPAPEPLGSRTNAGIRLESTDGWV